MHEAIAIFAGGCFWCTEPVFSQLNGVISVESGYIGGHTSNPTYKTISNGDTGHAEGIRITFDDNIINYEQLVEVLLVAHDPTTLNRQGNDVGTQYRSAIFYLDEAQKVIAERVIERFESAQVYDDPIVTELAEASTFYLAEDYHQYYFSNNPNQPYCLAVAAPKAAKIRAKYTHLIKS